MKFSILTFVAALALTASADYTFSGGRFLGCTGATNGSISCTESTDRAAAHGKNPATLRLDSRAVKDHGLAEMMSPVVRSAPLEARALEARASCEIFGTEGCFTHCFAVGYCHAHCDPTNICVCTCKDSTFGACLGTATCQ